MSSTGLRRLYLPISAEQLAMLAEGSVEVSLAHAVTTEVTRELADCDLEEQEFAVLLMAAADAFELAVPPSWRRVVAVAELEATDLEVSLVTPSRAVQRGDLRALYLDEDASKSILEAQHASGQEPDLDLLEELELLWFGPDEIKVALEILRNDE